MGLLTMIISVVMVMVMGVILIVLGYRLLLTRSCPDIECNLGRLQDTVRRCTRHEEPIGLLELCPSLGNGFVLRLGSRCMLEAKQIHGWTDQLDQQGVAIDCDVELTDAMHMHPQRAIIGRLSGYLGLRFSVHLIASVLMRMGMLAVTLCLGA